MRADRLLSIVLLLQQHKHLTAKSLSEALAVTERTIYRDIEALSLAGVPIYTRSGPDGGCFLDEGYRTSLSWFSGLELQTLMAGGNNPALNALGMGQLRDNAVLKLLALIPARHQSEAALMRQRLYFDSSGWYATTEPTPDLPILKEAVWGDYWIETFYETWEGERQTRRLAPYSLICKAERWYVAAKAAPDAPMLTYRAGRFSQTRLQSERFERDPSFDIEAYWAAASAQFLGKVPSYPVTLRAQPEAMPYFRTVLSGRYSVESHDNDGYILRVNYTVFEEARASVLGLGTLAEVIHPPELHTAVLDIARRWVDKYG